MENKTIGFNEEINVIGGNQGAIYSTDKKNRIKEIVHLITITENVRVTNSSETVQEDKNYYYSPTKVPVGHRVQFGRMWLGRDGSFVFI